jgi:FkbM family methyltransferase
VEKINLKTIFGKLLRLPFKLIPNNQPLTIMTGLLRGKKWISNAGLNSCWLGTYEYENQKIFQQYLKPEQIVFDIGAHVGFFSLLASILVGEKGKVFAFEPLPRNIFYFKKHLKLNQITNIELIEAAVSKANGVASFSSHGGLNGYQALMTERGKIQVKLVSLDELIVNQQIPIPDFIKIDVEAKEEWVLIGASSVLQKYHPTILLSIHGRPLYENCSQLLKSLNYKIKILSRDNKAELPKSLDLLAYY